MLVTLAWGIAAWDWRIIVGGQVVGWALQLLGHRIAGNRPAFVTRFWSLSFVMGPAMVLMEAISRCVPGVVQQASSVERDSFRGGLLDHPHYTRPAVVEGLAVPSVLLSGDHAAIERWRQREALRATYEKRPDLLADARLTATQREELEACKLRDGLG